MFSRSLIVNEIFGPTLQGEGPSTGRPCTFLRLGGCNLKCVWCDTPYTWDASRYDLTEENTRIGFEDIAKDLGKAGLGTTRTLVVSGGEPLLQDRSLSAMFDEWWKVSGGEGRTRVEVETAGTIIPRMSWPFVDQFNVSPKLAHSGNPVEKRRNPDALAWFASSARSYFKFVCVTPEDLPEVDELVKDFRIAHDRVYIMPEGITQDAINVHTRDLAPEVIARGYNLTQRLQITLWGNRRGV
jgi:7-carboxy-7-deazaguanine synthase